MTQDSRQTLAERIESTNYGPETPCSQCGRTIYEYSPEWTEYCFSHKEQRIDPLVYRLEAQIAEWREDADMDAFRGNFNAADQKYECADEVEELLQEHNEDES